METKEYSYAIQYIDIVEKLVFASHVNEGDQFGFHIKSQSGADEKNELVAIIVEISILKPDGSRLYAKYTFAFGFKIKDFNSAFERDEKGLPIIPINFENILKTIAISTSRGIIFSELRGTFLHNAIMPIMYPDTFKPVEGNLLEELKGRI